MPWDSQQQQQLPHSQKKPIQCQPIRTQQQQEQKCAYMVPIGQPTRADYAPAACAQGPGTSASVHQQQHQCKSQPQQSHQQLPEDVYRKLRQVDQQSSTLSGRGANSGFLARILDRREYKVQGNDVTVVQLVEIIKKPGQSLGLYLREGNGIDRFTGVFASRYGENSELERFGDIIRPGDEILNVNNVEVSAMSIDDVVLMLSIPRRLVLRIKYMKNRRDNYGTNESCVEHRPVIVFQKSLSEDHKHHGGRHRGHGGGAHHSHHDGGAPHSNANAVNDHGSMPADETSRGTTSGGTTGGILLKPASTASTWLGKRARQIQQQNDIYWQQQQQRQPVNYPPQQLNAAMSYVSGQPPPPQYQQFWDSRRMGQLPDNLYGTAFPAQPNLLRYPLSEQLGTRRRHPAYAMMNSPAGASANVSAALTPVVPRRPLTTVGVPSSNSLDYGSAGLGPYGNSAQLRPCNTAGAAPIWPTTSYASPTSAEFVTSMPYKSNSLPRRRFQSGLSTGTVQGRSVKWRNDLASAINSSTAQNRNPIKYNPTGQDSMSDIAGVNPRGLQPSLRYNQLNGSMGRTIADIFSAEEYRNWAGSGDETMSEVGQPTAYGHRSRWYDSVRPSCRSSSLPSKAILRNNVLGKGPTIGATTSEVNFPITSTRGVCSASSSGGVQVQQLNDGADATAKYASGILDRLHVSPILSRRVPLRTLGSGFDVDRLSVNALNGVLSVSIVEGHNLKVPDKLHSKQLYVVIEVNEVHRARTGISVPEQMFRWNESFEIDVHNATEAQFFVYAWHPQLRHLFCHKGSMRLLDALFVDQLGSNQIFTLNMEPSGQLLIRLAFIDMAQMYARKQTGGVFGCPLEQLLQKEKSETPIALTRLIREIEDRGIDSPGLYYLCAAVGQKSMLRNELERDSRTADLSVSPAPDVNLLAGLVKDYLRALPQPLIPTNIYAMLADAEKVVDTGAEAAAGGAGATASAEETSNNQQFVLRIIDCLPTPNKKTLILLMDHLRNLLTAEPHNGLTLSRISVVFGPLIFCTSETDQANAASGTTTEYGSYHGATKLNLLSIPQASTALKLLLQFWPSRVNSSESNSSSNATPS